MRKKSDVNDEQFKRKVEKAIQRLKSFEPEDGYYLAFSGGKDSQCIYHLAEMAGVKFEAEYRVTSVDPPELVQFLKKQYPNVRIAVPHDKNGNRITMWNLIPRKLMPPTRIVRYCCQELKESGGVGRVTVTGVRWAESSNRRKNQGTVAINTRSKKLYEQAEKIEGSVITGKGNIILNDDNDEARRMVEKCFRTRKTLVNPIIDWEDADVWAFLDDVVKVKHCILYDKGHSRIGCIGCPISHHSRWELDSYPKYKNSCLRSFNRMLDVRKEKGLETDWNTPEEVMEWWIKN